MITTRRILPAVAAAALAITACSGGSDESTPEVDDTETSVPAEPEADASDDFTESGDGGVNPADGEDIVEDDGGSVANGGDDPEEPGEGGSDGAVTVSLVEWAIEAPTEYEAGEITFSASNDGSFPHELVVIEGESYESLPLEDGGGVIEDELPTGALISRTARLGGGSAEDLTVTLEPGNYVLLCNVGAGGANSHAGQGQRLDITVS